MSYPIRYRLAVLLVFGIFTLGSPAQAGEDALPPEPDTQAAASENSAPPEPEAKDPALLTAPDRSGDEVDKPLEKAAGGPGSEVVAGPLQLERKQLLAQIMLAKEDGVGISSYMTAFKFMEDQIAKGATEEEIKQRMIPLVTALAGQLKTKTQMETARQEAINNPSKLEFKKGAMKSPGQPIPPELTRFGGMGAAGTKELVDSIVRQKMGGKLPEGVSSDTLKKGLKDPNIMDKLNDPNIRKKLSDPRIQELIRKYKK
ncbi:MAG: hypothetical protein K8F91_22540 [Candidatus Obscuribacterales bacterium]|nr:hypothetical protein [Candidatus Obscuribacterales bacterium]